ncbi:hypothetical protein, partial [Blautia hydrogenotrophica]|uniref:hypothetical protein n=1 Tax=Blautia hydrogenotrophica TaxID=53443 RepID=UPI00294344B7
NTCLYHKRKRGKCQMIKVDYEDFIRLIKAEEKLEIIKRMTDKDECILSKTLKKIIGESDENE